jgi:hypothetical protein
MSTSNKNFKVKNGLDANGDITTSADIRAANLRSTNSSGDEGGEILLAKPQTNSTIAGSGVTVDVYQNKLRFFEQGGDARGFYIDITGGGNGVGTNLVGGGSASDSFRTISTPSGTSPVADSSTDTLNLVAGSNITITGDSSSDSITFAATDTNTTYSISAETVSGGANLRLTGSDAATDDVKFEGSGSVTVTRTDANTVTISGSASTQDIISPLLLMGA